MNRSTRLKITDLNSHLSCILCGGYFIDATTITECVHSFCRACIVRYLETSKYCPVCEVQVHKSRPLHYIRSDKTLQDIVYKLVPGLFHNEMKRRRELYASQPPEAIKESRDAEDRGDCLDEKFIYAPDEIFSLSVEYGSETDNQDTSSEKDETIPRRRFLRCPAAVTVGHLKKFIRMKYGIPMTYEVDLQYDNESLRNEYTLMDVAYIFLWRRSGPMRFYYKILERPPKQLKIEPIRETKDIQTEEDFEVSEKDIKTETGDTKGDLSATAAETSITQSTSPLKQEKCGPIKIKSDTSVEVVATDEAKIDSQKTKVLKEEVDITKEGSENAATITSSSKKELKSNALKFLPTSSSKVSTSCSESKPAVMTVAPLTKPSTSLATTSTTASSGTITHGLYTGISIKKSQPDTNASTNVSSPTITHGQYTGISIKKSPPNTQPPFKISSHLLPPGVPPRVPPLKLSKESSSSKKSSSQGKKSKSSRNHIDRLESKVAQLKSASFKSVAPLVISVPQDCKKEPRKEIPESAVPDNKKETEKPPVNGEHVPPTSSSNHESPSLSLDDDKMDLDSDLFEGPLVIAEPDPPTKDDTENSNDKLSDVVSKNATKLEDPEDEEIDVVDDGEGDSGRGSDISSRAEARSLSGDDDLGSPDSAPKTPEADRQQMMAIDNPPPQTKSDSVKSNIAKCNGVANGVATSNSTPSVSNECGVLDLSTCSRKRGHEGDVLSHRSKPVANPAVLDKTRQTPCRPPGHPSFKVLSAVLPHVNAYKNKSENSGRNFKCRGNTLTVINTDPNSNRPKIVIKNLGPRPSNDRFHNHHNNHHNHHHHHQRM